MSRLLPLNLGICLALAACASGPSPITTAPVAADLGFLPTQVEKGRLFRVYLPGGPSIRARNWTSAFDFSGVSWNDKRTATAISRRHVVMAGHYARNPSTPVIFHDSSGQPHSRQLIGITHLRQLGDIAIGTLDTPLPSAIRHYPLADLSEVKPMMPVLVTDQTQTISVHRLGGVDQRRIILGYDPKIPRGYWRNLVTGDSGNPAFIIHRGSLHLLTTFTTGGPGSGPFYGDPQVRAGVLAAIRP